MRQIIQQTFIENPDNVDVYSGKPQLVQKLRDVLDSHSIYKVNIETSNSPAGGRGHSNAKHTWGFPDRPLMYFELLVSEKWKGSLSRNKTQTCLGTLYYAECPEDNSDLQEAINLLYSSGLKKKVE